MLTDIILPVIRLIGGKMIELGVRTTITPSNIIEVSEIIKIILSNKVFSAVVVTTAPASVKNHINTTLDEDNPYSAIEASVYGQNEEYGRLDIVLSDGSKLKFYTSNHQHLDVRPKILILDDYIEIIHLKQISDGYPIQEICLFYADEDWPIDTE
jgi:hypothetical protein